MTDNDENVFAVKQHKELSRRRFLTGTARTLGTALASTSLSTRLSNHPSGFSPPSNRR